MLDRPFIPPQSLASSWGASWQLSPMRCLTTSARRFWRQQLRYLSTLLS